MFTTPHTLYQELVRLPLVVWDTFPSDRGLVRRPVAATAIGELLLNGTARATPEILSESLGELTDEQINKITHVNAMREFQFDPYAHRSQDECRVGALRALSPDVDLSEISQPGSKPPAEDATGIITTADVTKQLMTAFAVPVDE